MQSGWSLITSSRPGFVVRARAERILSDIQLAAGEELHGGNGHSRVPALIATQYREADVGVAAVETEDVESPRLGIGKDHDLVAQEVAGGVTGAAEFLELGLHVRDSGRPPPPCPRRG